MIGYNEILEESIKPNPQDKDERDDNTLHRKKLKAGNNVIKKLQAGKMNFTALEKKTIGSALSAFIDTIEGNKNEDDGLESSLKFAKILQKKYPYTGF